MAAPTPTIDTEGVMSWTIDTEPYHWIMSFVFPDGTKPPNVNFDYITVSGVTDSYDLTTIFPGGYGVILYGVDSSGNLMLTPSTATGLTVTPGAFFLSIPKTKRRKTSKNL
jgi:hypothetical protein